RDDPRAGGGPHAPPRLPRQPAPGRCRDAALLSPGGVVDLAPGADRARELLRRPGGRRVRESRPLRPRAGSARGAAHARAVDRAVPDRRPAVPAGPAAGRRPPPPRGGPPRAGPPRRPARPPPPPPRPPGRSRRSAA